MKKNALIIIVLTLLSFNLFAQTYILQFKQMGSKDWGYLNIKEEVIIKPEPRKCYPFSEEGLALVYYPQEKNYDIINLKNEVLDIEPEHFLTKPGSGFSSGMLVIRMKKKWGAINNKGKLVVPVKYHFLSKFIDGYATARINANTKIVDSTGNATFLKKDHYYILDSTGKEIEIKEPGIIKITKFSEGLSVIKNNNGLMGFINTRGQVVIPLKYKTCGYFSSGVAWARNSDGMIGYIDKSGKWIIEPKFTAAKNFDPVSQLAKVRIGDTWGYINKKGEIRYVKNVKKIYNYSEGLAMAANQAGLFGFLDKNRAWVIQPQFSGARDFVNGHAAAKLHGKWGIIDKTGEWVIKPNYSGIKDVMKVN